MKKAWEDDSKNKDDLKIKEELKNKGDSTI